MLLFCTVPELCIVPESSDLCECYSLGCGLQYFGDIYNGLGLMLIPKCVTIQIKPNCIIYFLYLNKAFIFFIFLV